MFPSNKSEEKNTFTRKDRLLTSCEYREIFQRAHKISSDSITVFFKKNTINRARLGFIISKKYIKNSVDRNRIRRIIRESFRFSKLILKKFDIVILVKQKISRQDKKALRQKIDLLWEKISIQ